MMYGLSKAIDILSVTVFYGHSSSEACRFDLERALSAIGHYALTVVSTINVISKSQQATANKIKREVFESRNLNSDFFMPRSKSCAARIAIGSSASY